MDTKEYIKQVMSENNERLKLYIQQQVTNGSSGLTSELIELRQQNQLLQQEIDSLNNILDNINRESVWVEYQIK